MAFRSHPFFLPFFEAYLLVCLSCQTFRGHTTLTPTINSSLEGFHQGCDWDTNQREANCSWRGLEAVPQNLSKDVERLILSNNDISSLLNSSFRRYPNITFLDISMNKLGVIEPAAFYPLKELKELTMSSNPHLVLPDTGLFRWASNLASLILDSSGIESLPSDTLKWSRHLHHISVSFNPLSFINFSTCGRIENFLLSANKIEHLTADSFAFSCHTSLLDLGANPIKSVDPGVIASLKVRSLDLGFYPMTSEVIRDLFIGISHNPEIEEVTIQAANLTALPTETFEQLGDDSLHNFSVKGGKELYTRLRRLNLSDNNIAEIKPDLFKDMPKLRELNLNNNKIVSVNRHGHSWPVDLLRLDLSVNLLTEISAGTFHGLRNLTVLNLGTNKRLAVVEITALTELSSIQELDLSESSITDLFLETPTLRFLYLMNNVMGPFYLRPGNSFKYTPSLLTLNLAESELYMHYMWNSTLEVSLFDGLFNLTTLDLSRNRFDSSSGDLKPGVFRELSALVELSLDKCKISHLHPLVFTGLESLHVLYLRGNIIQNLHYDLLKGLAQVITIYLDENLLTVLDDALFSNNTRLETLSLANNKLTLLNQGSFQPIDSSLTSLDLSLNPIVCDCHLKWFPKWLQRQVQLKNEENTICSPLSLAPFREKSLKDFDPKELCKPKMVVSCLISLAVVCSLVILVLVHHNRWLLRLKLFVLKLAVIGYKEMQDARDHNDYEFDVNIIFYDEDEEWVREHLRPALEEHLPQFQRNIFGDEHPVLGMHYLDSVDYVVNHSYKTMILLSRAAVRDRWFMLKLLIAMDHVTDTQTEFVVVVFLEDIPNDEIPFLARLYLSDGRPYLYWTEDQRGQGYFWNELAEHLTINLRTNDLIPNE